MFVRIYDILNEIYIQFNLFSILILKLKDNFRYNVAFERLRAQQLWRKTDNGQGNVIECIKQWYTSWYTWYCGIAVVCKAEKERIAKNSYEIYIHVTSSQK